MANRTVKTDKKLESLAVEYNNGVALEVRTPAKTSRKNQVQKQVKTEPAVTQPKAVKPTVTKPLRTVPFENGFHFYTSIRKYTGVTATNLSEFATKLQTVPAESITFHFQRQDFQKWIQNTIEDSALAKRIDSIKRDITVEDLRKEILKTVEAVLIDLSS
jgi:hypothetical protein